MNFDAVIGNPPYQVSDGGAQASATPVYNLFVDIGKQIDSRYISMIMPSRWMTGGKGLDDFRNKMIHDTHIKKLCDHIDSHDCFINVDIKGGVCYLLRDKNYDGLCDVVTYTKSGISQSLRKLSEDGEEIFIRENRLISIKNKIQNVDNSSFESLVSSMKPFGLRGDIFKDTSKYGLPPMSDYYIEGEYTIYGLDEKLKRVKKYVAADYPFPKTDYILGYKLFVSRNQGTGVLGEEFSTPIFAKPGECCTETFVVIGLFNTETEMYNCWKYIKTKLFRALVGIRKQDQGASKAVYHYVPMQDFTEHSDIDWSKSISEIDAQLYRKYALTPDEITFIETMIKPME
jgi:site-specific DNA-methyltransferase (adenine-specific)